MYVCKKMYIWRWDLTMWNISKVNFEELSIIYSLYIWRWNLKMWNISKVNFDDLSMTYSLLNYKL